MLSSHSVKECYTYGVLLVGSISRDTALIFMMDHTVQREKTTSTITYSKENAKGKYLENDGCSDWQRRLLPLIGHL